MTYKYNQAIIKERISRLNLAIIGSLLAIMAAVGLMTFAVLQASAANTTTVVTPTSSDGWTFVSENTAGGSGSFVGGPATPPLGSGSAEFEITASNQGYILAKQGFARTRIADLTQLEYSTYVQTGNNTIAPALQFNFDPDVTDTKTQWYSRIVYEPYFNGTVVDGSWQTWDAIEGGDAEWWLPYNAAATTDYGANPCPQSNPCTVDELLTAFPNAGVRNDAAAAVLFKAGSGWNVPFLGNVDKLVIGTGSDTITYDFEAINAPVIESPANNSVVTTAELDKINWTDVLSSNNPVTYEYRAFSDAGYTSNIYSSGSLANSEIPTPGTPEGNYYVQVRATDSLGNVSPWSNDASNPYLITVDDTPPQTTPTNKDECKKDGWKTFNNPVFKNQGQCVSYVVSKKPI